MKGNPADKINDNMWEFLMAYGQKANVARLRESVYDLIRMMTQKSSGQRKGGPKDYIDISENLDMTVNSIVIEAAALVLSGELDKLEEKADGRNEGRGAERGLQKNRGVADARRGEENGGAGPNVARQKGAGDGVPN